MNVYPAGAHIVTIHQGPAAPAAQGGLAQADPGASRVQLAMDVSERRIVMAQRQNNANVRGALQAANLELDRREVALEDREVRLLPNFRLGVAGCLTAGGVSVFGSAISVVLARQFEMGAQAHAVADGMSIAGLAMAGLSLGGALCAVGAARLSARQLAQVQTERDRLLGQEDALQEEAAALEARDLDLKQAQDKLVRHVTRHDVEQETGMPMVLVNRVVGYLADEDLPQPPLPAPAGS